MCAKHIADRDALLNQAAATSVAAQKRNKSSGAGTGTIHVGGVPDGCLKHDLLKMEVDEHSAFITILKDFCKT